MTEAEVIIVGGGPAGSTCAWKLRQAGVEALILDKQAFPRPKPCAGWITPRLLRNLQLDVNAYPHTLLRFDRLHFHYAGRRFALPTRQYSIRRCEFDHWLLERAGVPVHRESVKHIRNEGGRYTINDSYRCTHLVGAGGTWCPVYQTFFRELNPRAQEVEIVAMEAEMVSDSTDRECHLWFSERDLPGYAWYTPKGGGFLNIGIGGKSLLLRQQGSTIRNHWDHLVHMLANLSLIGTPPPHPAGHIYYLRHTIHSVQRGNAYVIGDAAGLATKDMGEGIGPAVESGIRAAEAIARRTVYSVNSIPRYSFLDLVFPWRR